MTDQLRFSFTIEGVVDLNGLSVEEGTRLLKAELDGIGPHITSWGMITGHTELTVDSYSERVEVAPEEDPRPTPEQRAAVRRFAEQYGGRWKAELHICWMNASYPRSPEADRPLLQQVRNQFGPLWLERVTLKDLED